MNDQTQQMGKPSEYFRTTRWSLISEIKDPQSPQTKRILNALLADYWKPIYFHICKKGYDPEQANDLTQGFFYSVLYEKDLFSKVKHSKGRFRSYLLTALNHYLVSEYRYQHAKKRSGHRTYFDLEQFDSMQLPESLASLTEEQSFDYAWITTLIDNISCNVQQHLNDKGKKLYWEVFDRRVKQPIIEGTQPPSLSEICAEYGIEDEATASNIITTVKRAFRKELRTHIREYVHSDSEVSEEIAEFLDFLRKIMQDAT